MEQNVISITLWGNGTRKENWVKWYYEVGDFIKSIGYTMTHIGIQSLSFNGGKILTVARKEKEILAKISEGESPVSFSCYSLPSNYKIASFDYDFLCVRKENYISVIVKEVDYCKLNIRGIISMINKYMDYEYGEIYMTSKEEMPLVYAETRRADYIKSYTLIEKI